MLHIIRTSVCQVKVYTELISSGIPNLEPPPQLLSRIEQRRGSSKVRTVRATSGRLDRDVVVTAEVPVADPDANVRGRADVPPELDRGTRLPLQPRPICLPASQEHLATLSCRRTTQCLPNPHFHVFLVTEKWVRTPVSKQGLVADVRVHVIEANRGVGKRNPPRQLPRQHAPRALHGGFVDHGPGQAPRLAVIR